MTNTHRLVALVFCALAIASSAAAADDRSILLPGFSSGDAASLFGSAIETCTQVRTNAYDKTAWARSEEEQEMALARTPSDCLDDAATLFLAASIYKGQPGPLPRPVCSMDIIFPGVFEILFGKDRC